MGFLSIVVLPVVTIVVVIRLIKLRWPSALLAVFGLSAVSTFIVDYVFCNILERSCEPDALSAVGYFFHWLIVSGLASIADFFIYKVLIQQAKPGGD
jgi:hypothetical protein